MSADFDQKLDEVFAAYRESLPNCEASANFTPELWKRIEARRCNVSSLPHLALDDMFAAYREAFPDRDVSANFTPELWKRIEQGRRSVFSFPRFARGFVTAALALCFAMAAVNWPSTASYSASSSPSTYVDVLEEDPQPDAEVHGETL
jgi:hypothetical protein